MEAVLTTADKPRRERFDYWRHIVTETFTPLNPWSPDPGAFSGTVRNRRFRSIDVARIAASAQRARHGEREVDGCPGDRYFLVVHNRGPAQVLQDGAALALAPGDAVIVDTARPFELAFTSEMEQISVTIPKGLWHDRSVYGPPRVASRIRGIGALLNGYLTLFEAGERADGIYNDALADNLLDLCVLLGGRSERALAEDPSPLVLDRKLAAVRGYVLDHLGEEDLSPALIATALGLSVRSLHKLFEGSGTTVGRFVLEQRLRRSRRELDLAFNRHKTVAEIAFDCGFGNLSSFGRAFKARYGVSPRAYRRLRLSSRPA